VATEAGTGTARTKVTPTAVRSLVSMARHYPGTFADNSRSPEPRAAVQIFFEIYSRPSLSWADLAGLRDRTNLPVVLKGVLHPDDARRAVDHGVDAVIVSNHGGRQVDHAIAALDALPGVVDAAGDLPVLMDSGIRSGADVAVALAQGARAVLLGLAYAYGLALAGHAGVRQVLADITAEPDLTMALIGVGELAGLTRDVVVRH